MGDHQVDPVGHRARGGVGRVPSVAGLHDLQLHVAGQRVGQHVPAGGGGRRRLWVDHEKGTHPSRVGQTVTNDRPSIPVRVAVAHRK
ncbi:hypothetical protein GCM10018954_058260 [Kutzneria kofuensis]